MSIKIRDSNNLEVYLDGIGAGTEVDPFIPSHKSSQSGPANFIFAKQMDTVGDGSGSSNMGVNGSSTPVLFKLGPPAGEIWRINRAIFYVQDTGIFTATKWGSNIVMANGLDFTRMISSTSYPLFETPVKTTGNVAALTFDTNVHTYGTGDEFMVSRWTFTKMGAPIRLIGDNSDQMILTVNDDLSLLTEQTITLQGYIE